jgi:hypothetical protein
MNDQQVARDAGSSGSAPLDLEAIKERAAAATPGPWLPSMNGEGVWSDVIAGRAWANMVCRVWPAMKNVESDAVFIAEARADVPALVAECERLRASLHLNTCGQLDCADCLAAANVILPNAGTAKPDERSAAK